MRCRWENNIKMDFREIKREAHYDPAVCFCGYNNELTGSIKVGRFLIF